jgi:malate synthase
MQKITNLEIPYYQDYVSHSLQAHLSKQALPVAGVPDLKQVGDQGGLESQQSLTFICELYDLVKDRLAKVLSQRQIDRKFIDERTKSYYQFNQEYDIDFLSAQYKTIIGDKDANDRIVIGPINKKDYANGNGKKVAPLPDYLQGNHVTLFGPPDNAKLSVNAMNAFHRKLKGEPEVVERILKNCDEVPKWGADDEDSKTPLRKDLIEAGVNLKGCLDGDLEFKDEKRNKHYQLAKDKLSFPIKRFPGLALPCPFLFYRDNPIPLHLYDFALHLYEHWHNPEGLVFYVPKLENEEEAAYIKFMLETAEKLIKEEHPEYEVGTIRVIIVLENPRAVFRVNEIMDELYPYFAGASLGWHDYLGSTARLFKEDANYRIPVKADPDIVIKYIKASHDLLADVVGERGGIKIGGMYGILPVENDLMSDSFQITIKGFFRDVITQMKRNLSGFWVAHPDFVRIGMAIVQSWRSYVAGDEKDLKELVEGLLKEEYSQEIWTFIKGDDITGLDKDDPLYGRSLIVTDIKESNVIANHDPEEVRYNVFQTLQYLTDWLSGNGCVALPTQVDGIPARVMDDLATAERSRWEVWHEIYHGRVSIAEFIKIAHEEMNFIRRDLSNDKKIVQVKYTNENSKWYDVAMRLMLKLMTDAEPVEFATELLMPFTLDIIREAEKPWEKIESIDPVKYKIDNYVLRYHYYFEMCGSDNFAEVMAKNIAVDPEQVEKVIMNFSMKDILQAASFHGNIGESSKNLDAMAKKEQENVSTEPDAIKNELLTLGDEYLNKFGMKFLISARGKTADYLLEQLKTRLNNTREVEKNNAKKALLHITLIRMGLHPLNDLKEKISSLFSNSKVKGMQLSISNPEGIQTLCFGEAREGEPVESDTLFEIASLSKTFGTAYAHEVFEKNDIFVETGVNELLEKYQSPVRIKSTVDSQWDDKLKVKHLMSHCALNMHYVNGVPASEEMPEISGFISGNEKYGYPAIDIINSPGDVFKYSGAGFIVLEYLCELITGKNINESSKQFFENLDLEYASFNQKSELESKNAYGFRQDGSQVTDGYLKFPAFAAGMITTSNEVLTFLRHLTLAYHQLEGSGGISHDTAVEMLHGTDKGCQEFMGAFMGRGVFIVEAGDNRFALHQGANDGFRAIHLYCFDGPDMHKGLCLLCNGELDGVILNSLVTQQILKALSISGIDTAEFEEDFNIENIAQEEVVNIGYKKLIFNAFKPTLPEEIVDKGPMDPLSKYNLAVSANIVKVSNQRFARAENLLSPYQPVFDPKLFGKQGKIMDSWESARHNEAEFDELVIQLQEPSVINYIYLSTKYHFGNQAPFIRILSNNGEVLLDKTAMDGHAEMKIAVSSEKKWEILKVQIFPDGGFTRLGLFKDLPVKEQEKYVDVSNAKCVPFQEEIPQTQKPMTISVEDLNLALNKEGNLASLAYGAKVVSATDEHYAPAKQVLSPYPPIHMFDGLESKRSREEGHREEIVIELPEFVDVGRVEMDFTYFVNNNPISVELEFDKSGKWEKLIHKSPVKAFAGNKKSFYISKNNKAKKIRLIVYPDGGINRIKVYKR